jgi:hypothetical protein
MSSIRYALVAGLVLFLVLAAALRMHTTASTPSGPLVLPEEFGAAAVYESFLAADTAAESWRARYAAASKVVEPFQARVARLEGQWYLLVVAETWCSDATNSVPYLARLADESPNLELRVLRRADAKSLLDAHKIDGRGRIPLVLVLDSTFTEWGAFIERPAALRRALDEPSGEDRGTRVRAWYAADGGREVLRDVTMLLEGAARGVAVATGAVPEEYETVQCEH